MVTKSVYNLVIPVDEVPEVITLNNPTSEYFSLHQLKQLEALPDNEIAKTLFDMLPNQWCIEFMHRIYRADATAAVDAANATSTVAVNANASMD